LQLGAGAGLAAAAAPYLATRGPAGVLLDRAEPVLAAMPNWPPPAIITRAQWGANEALRKPGAAYDAPVRKIVVHHTGTPNSITDYAGLCRSIFASETAGEYLDIAYNWLIDPLGRIYEGRWAANYPAGAPHTGERAGRNVRGAHAIWHNTETIGVALMGNYDVIPPPAAMIDALVRLLAWKCARWGIDPRGRGLYAASSGTHDIFNICGHRDTSATACPGGHVQAMLPGIRTRVTALVSGGGYWIASRGGQVVAIGGVPARGGVHIHAAAFAARPGAKGYWLASAEGAVHAFGTAQHYGGQAHHRLNGPIVDMAASPSGKGYWLVGADGGIFRHGDAKFYGSTGNLHLNAPVLGMLPTRTGKGYWLYARDGGVFTFGDAKFLGSTGSLRLNRPIVSMAARPQGDGYWLVAEDGGVFRFGKAPFVGSGASVPRYATCVGMLPTTTGRGYLLLWSDGSVSNYGDAPNLGGARGKLRSSALGIDGKLKPV
jgi:hypothetical protein